MIKKAKRYFNTSGPNIPAEHYTLKREKLIEKGIALVNNSRYFTIWAPRQTGKSTYFRLLAKELIKKNFKVTHINLENYSTAPLSALFSYLFRKIKENWGIELKSGNLGDLHNDIAKIKDRQCVLIIDEIEGLNPELFGQFLHTIRNLYHSREDHALKSVILVGVSNILGVVQDNASPFNIADNLPVPYFTKEETFALLGQHEAETGQFFTPEVKKKIPYITANQPGLVNAFAYKLVERFEDKELIDYDHYLNIEDWFLTEAIDKNIGNIVNKARLYRQFIERLLFKREKIKFDIERESIKFLHIHGLLKKGSGGFVEFWVPLYKKKLLSAFYPHSNGESDFFFRRIDLDELFFENGDINFDRLIENYKDYVKRRSFRYFREKDKDTGAYLQIKEAALMYSFDTYINNFLAEIGGKSYLEPHTGLGISDLIINYNNKEYVFEAKIYRNNFQFRKGKKQLAYYCRSIGVLTGIYLVFLPNDVKSPEVKDNKEELDGVAVGTYIIEYDEEKDF